MYSPIVPASAARALSTVRGSMAMPPRRSFGLRGIPVVRSILFDPFFNKIEHVNQGSYATAQRRRHVLIRPRAQLTAAFVGIDAVVLERLEQALVVAFGHRASVGVQPAQNCVVVGRTPDTIEERFGIDAERLKQVHVEIARFAVFVFPERARDRGARLVDGARQHGDAAETLARTAWIRFGQVHANVFVGQAMLALPWASVAC